MARILVLNGPNLNLLGTREPAVYGSDTLADIVGRLQRLATARGATLTALQSNAEHELIAAVQDAKASATDAIIFNAGAFTHTSIALRDALAGVLAAQQRYSHVVDGRFKGGYITRHYGLPARGRHAVQLEMTQCSYMQEAMPFHYLPEVAARIQPTVRTMLEVMLAFAESKVH